MKFLKNSKIVFLFIMIFSLASFFSACSSVAEDNRSVSEKSGSSDTVYEGIQSEEVSVISIVDDMGNEILLEKPAEKIISLYSAHTENLFELGLSDEIVGVSSSDIYPVNVLEKEVYSYKDDPERLIAVAPDLVLIRPFINRNYPDFVALLENSGVKVISLYCDTYEGFDDYIMKLGKITGKEDIAQMKLDEFHKNISNIYESTKNIKDKVNVYFESTEKDYRTITQNSMAANAIKFAGGNNIAYDVEPISEGSSIAAYGEEKLLSKANDIDVYISQVGAMNSGGNLHSIEIRPGFDTIKAVKDKRVYLVNQKLVSSATFRYYKGINELARMFYPDFFGDIYKYASDEDATRKDVAKMVVFKSGKSFYIPSSKYYNTEHEGHTHGFFKDVDYKNEYYDYVETAVMSGYMEGFKENSNEFFYPESFLTKDEFAKIIFKMGNFKSKDQNIEITDLQQCENAKIIQILVDNSILSVDGGKFNPDSFITYNDLIDAFNKF